MSEQTERQVGQRRVALRRMSERELLHLIVERLEDGMAGIDDLRGAVTDLSAKVSGESAELGQVVTGLQNATAQIAALQAQLAGGSTVTEADLEALTQSIAQVAQGAADATSAAVAGTQPPAPAQRSVYTTDGDPSAVDATSWPGTGLQTTESPPRPVFFYAGDTSPGDKNGDGVGGVWHLYTGQTAPAGS